MSKTLVWVEHDNTSVKDATLAVVTAASQLGEVTALVVGSGVDGVAAAAAQIAGVTKVLKADDAPRPSPVRSTPATPSPRWKARMPSW